MARAWHDTQLAHWWYRRRGGREVSRVALPLVPSSLSILVGQQLGRNKPDMAARATWTSLWLATL